MCIVLWIILCFICPPLAVGLKHGCDVQLLINLILTLLGIVPGIIHGLIVICCMDDDE